jgi:Transposase DDE domain
MSFRSNDTAEKGRLQEAQIVDGWEQEIVPLLPKNLEEFAFRLGAMRRKKGKLLSASDLLRGILAYDLFAGSFRLLGAWGTIREIADMADTSWRDRLRKSGPWLEWLLNEQIRPEKNKPLPSLKKAGYGAVELIDASHFKCVGVKGKTWRFHCMYSLCTQQLHQVVLTDTHVAESVKNFTLKKGAIYVDDSAYGYRKEYAAIDDAGAYGVSAFFPKTFPLENGDGSAIDVVSWLKKFRAKEGVIKELSAFFYENGKRYECRVIALRRTEKQKKKDLEKRKRIAGRKHRSIQKETLYLSNWLMVITTLPEKDWTAQEILSLYRARWQIEIFFKRIKQLLKKHILRAQTEKTAKATIASILVSWVLQDELACEMRTLLEGMYKEMEEREEKEKKEEEKVEQVLSEWVLQKVSMNLFIQNVQGPLTRQRTLECLPKLKRHLGDSPRKRTHQWQRVMKMLVDPEKIGVSLEGGKSRKNGSALTAALA